MEISIDFTGNTVAEKYLHTVFCKGSFLVEYIYTQTGCGSNWRTQVTPLHSTAVNPTIIVSEWLSAVGGSALVLIPGWFYLANLCKLFATNKLMMHSLLTKHLYCLFFALCCFLILVRMQVVICSPEVKVQVDRNTFCSIFVYNL